MMTERELVDQKIRSFMEGLWERGDSMGFRKIRLMSAIDVHSCSRCLRASVTVACSRSDAAPVISRVCSLAHADHIVALDISQTAIDRARSLSARVRRKSISA